MLIFEEQYKGFSGELQRRIHAISVEDINRVAYSEGNMELCIYFKDGTTLTAKGIGYTDAKMQ